MMLRILLSLFLSAAAFPAQANDPQDIANTVIADWQGWMARHAILAGSIIISHNGTVIGESGIARSVDDPAKVASLSKAITAVCALKALDQADKGVQTSLAEAIPAALAAHTPRDSRFADITVAQLITHASGIDTDYHRDELGKLRTFTVENKLWQFSKIADENLSGPPAWAPYRYSNANYLILGLAIEELTGEDYEAYCQREVLEAVGATSAQLNPDWRVMTSWGGWEISARDYLAFAEQNFAGANSPMRPAGFNLPASDVGRGRGYSAGMIFRRTEMGPISWHQGSWNGVRGRVPDQFGAYVALYENGFSIVTNYADDAWDSEIINELDGLLYRGLHP